MTYEERNRLSAVLLKMLDIYTFNDLAKINKIGVTHLYSAVELKVHTIS